MVILNSMNYSPLNSEIGNKKVKSDNQGLEYIKKYDSITEYGEIKPIEGFSNLYGKNAVDNKNSSEINQLLKLQKDYQEKLSNYSQTYGLLMSNINQYFELRKSPLLNKNIRLSDGKIGYVTSEGLFKPYPNMEIFNATAGKRNCPTEFIQVEATIVDGKVTTTPPFIVGDPMESEQSCGYEGKNVFASGTGTPGTHVYKGCYKAPPKSDYFSYQEGLGEKATFETCKQLAHDTGSSVFALSGATTDKLKCYIGSSIDTLRTNGESLTTVISWETPSNVNAINAFFNQAGQLLIKGNVTTSVQSNLQSGLTFKLYRGYMNDDVNFFKNAPVITQGISTKFSSISQATNNSSDNNSTKISIEWVGYLKSNITANYTLVLSSDDCSYMWIGDNAISNYTKNNAFINNGGLHPTTTKINTMLLNSNTYYPVRIQFGQKLGNASFSLVASSNNIQFLTTPNPFSSQLITAQDNVVTNGNLWKSNEPISGCNPKYGGKINLTDSVATWGYNCNSYKSPITGTQYNVPMGNLTEDVKASLEKTNGISFDYIIGKNMSQDPAYGCTKNFSANYKCGDGPDKQIFKDREAGGRIANYNCVEENKKCNFILNVQDDGNLVIYSYDSNNTPKPLWNSNTYNIVGVSDPNKKASNGKFKRNYMLPGETLEDGEFVGSNNGKCFLTMIKGRGLLLMYNKSNCKNIDGKMYGISEPSDGNVTAASYVIPENDLTNFYKTGYIDRNSVLRQYGNDLLTKSNSYTDTGNFRLDGNPTKTIQTSDLNECKTACNNDSDCDGFVFGNNTCDLRSSASMFPNVKRYTDANVTLYKRLKKVDNNVSCSKDVVPVSIDQYSGYVQGDAMTKNVICGLGVYNEKYYQQLNTDLISLQDNISKINQRLSNLSETDKKILSENGLTESKLRKDIISIQNMRNKFTGFKPQLETVKGMEFDAESEMMSSSYYNILWSILAIMIVIGGIKMSK